MPAALGSYRGRLAPSPTGLLHLGHARTFWIAYQRALAARGTLILRNEDLDPDRVLPSCIGGSRAAPPEDCTGALDSLKRLNWQRSHLPIDELGIMAEAMRRFLDSDGDRCAIGDLDKLREAVDRMKAYQDFQPDKFERRQLNLGLRALIQDREVRR